MAAIEVHHFAECITCHAWSPDHSMIALCPNTTEVHIYRFVEEKWERTHVLQKHDQIVSGIDWSITSNRIVTVSHDRNSYVWNQEGSEWVPTLVILRLNRAALCVQWSPGGDGGGPSECDNQYYSDDTPVVALSIGWYKGGERCHNFIMINVNGQSVKAMVVNECDSTMGCDEDHDNQPPYPNNIVDASKALWKALGIPKDN